MLKTKLPSDKALIQCLNVNYGFEIIELTPLPLGADIEASIYKAITTEKTYFVKLKRGNSYAKTAAIMDLLQHAGIQVIVPIKTIHGESTQSIYDFTLIVYPFIEGQDGFNRHLTDDQWLNLGNGLRQLHEIDVPLSLRQQIRIESYSPKWREALQSYLLLLDEEKGKKKEIRSIQILDEISQKLLGFIEKNMHIIRRLVYHSEKLAEIVNKQSPVLVLCHSDIHGGNVFMDESNALYIVDWDDPIMAPKERDLMFIGGGVANVWNKPHEEKIFYSGYGKTDINKEMLAYYRHERIVEDIAIYIKEVLFTTKSSTEKAVMYQQFVDMFEPNGVIEIALSGCDLK